MSYDPIAILVTPPHQRSIAPTSVRIHAFTVHGDGHLEDCTEVVEWSDTEHAITFQRQGEKTLAVVERACKTVICAELKERGLIGSTTLHVLEPAPMDILVISPWKGESHKAYWIREQDWKQGEPEQVVFPDELATLINQGVRFANLTPEQGGILEDVNVAATTCYLLNLKAF